VRSGKTIGKATLALLRRHRIARIAAALAFYALFSLPPLVLIVVVVLRSVLGPAHALATIDAELRPLLGANGAKGIGALVVASQQKIAKTPIYVSILLIIASITGIFMQIQEALDDLWEIPEHKRGGAWEIVALRLHVVAATGALMLFSVLAFFAAAAAGRAGGLAVSALAIVAFLVLAYRVLPRAEVSWKNSAIGAVATALIVFAGEALLSVYFRRFHPESGYGRFASLVIVLLWTYYSSLLFLFGAVLTRALEAPTGQER
jgi:membrane protein